MTKEIKLEKRKPTFDYILNDLAFDSLMFRVVNGIGSSQDKFDFDYQVKLMQKEISHLRQNKARTIEYIKNEMPYLQEVDEEFEDINGNTYFTYKEWNDSELLNILQGSKEK